MKNKIMAMLVAFGLVGSVSAIEINENLSINGFIDGSYKSTDFNDKSSPASGGDSTDIGIDEIELDFLFSAGGAIGGELHLDSAVANDDDQLDIEQVHLSYDFEGGLSLTAGKFSVPHSVSIVKIPEVSTPTVVHSLLPEDSILVMLTLTNKKVLRVTYTADQFTASLSAFNGVGDAEETAPVAGPPESLARKTTSTGNFLLPYTGIENLALGGGVQTNNEETLANADTTVINVTGVYTMGKALIGAEWSHIDSDNNAAADRDAYQILVDYDVSDVLGFAVRYSRRR